MKKAFIVVGVVCALIAFGVFAVLSMTSGLVNTADAFFAEVAVGNMQKAHEYLSEEFRAATSAEDLQQFLADSALQEYQSADWSNRSIANGAGELTGVVRTKGGGSIPLKVSFVKEATGWKIYAIQKQLAGLHTERPAEASLPTKSEAAELVKDTTRKFAAALKAKDFSDFHSHTAAEFREQISLDKFNEIFAEFLAQEIDLTPLGQLDPFFTAEPALSADGELLLEGYYNTKPSRTLFTYRYIYRDGDWQLLSISIKLKPLEA